MKVKILSSIATIPLALAGVVLNAAMANAATIGSRFDFSGSVFGSNNQFDFIDSSTLVPTPNKLGNFQVNSATGSFAPALESPSQLGEIRDIRKGFTTGLIDQAGPLFDGSNNPNLFVSDFLRINVPNSINFSFQLETVDRSAVLNPNSPDPLDPLVESFSSLITGTLTDLTTNEMQLAVGSLAPSIPANTIPISQFNNFFGPVVYNGTLEVASVPEPNNFSAAFAVLWFFIVLSPRYRSRTVASE